MSTRVTNPLRVRLVIANWICLDASWSLVFFKMGQSRPLFVYFCYFLDSISIIQIEKSVDGVLGTRTRGRRMVGADETTELWLPPEFISLCLSFLCSFISRYKTKLLVTGFELRICGVGSDRSTNCATTIMARSYQKYSISPKLFLFEDFLLH